MNNKYEELFVITSTSSNIQLNLPNTLELPKNGKYKLGLKYFSVYNSIRNITENNNDFRFSTDGGTNYQTVQIPPGSYEIASLNDYISTFVGEGNIEFKPNISLNRVELLLKNNRRVDFSINGSFQAILGFNQQIYTQTTLAQNRANIQNDINVLNIQCDIISGGYFNTVKKILYILSRVLR